MIDFLKSDTENNYPKAIAVSVMLLAGFLILSIFYIVSRAEPPEEVGTGGIIVNYGTSDIGMGDDYMSVDEPSVDPNANLTAPDKVIPEVDPTPQNATSQNSENDIVTQDNEDAVAVKTNTTSTSKAPSQNTEVKDSKPVVNQNALYKGNKNAGSGKGDGTGAAPGNQGKPEGDPLASNYDGTGSGNGGVGLSLASRRFVSAPVIKDDGQERGKIVIEIKVNRNGEIIAASGPARGSTILTPSLVEKCENAALGSRFNTLDKAPETQIGYITFNFKVK